MYRGADGQFTLYDDDGISQEYLRGAGSWIRMSWNDRAGQLTLEPGAPPGATNLSRRAHVHRASAAGGGDQAGDVFGKADSGPILTPLRHASSSLTLAIDDGIVVVSREALS